MRLHHISGAWPARHHALGVPTVNPSCPPYGCAWGQNSQSQLATAESTVLSIVLSAVCVCVCRWMRLAHVCTVGSQRFGLSPPCVSRSRCWPTPSLRTKKHYACMERQHQPGGMSKFDGPYLTKWRDKSLWWWMMPAPRRKSCHGAASDVHNAPRASRDKRAQAFPPGTGYARRFRNEARLAQPAGGFACAAWPGHLVPRHGVRVWHLRAVEPAQPLEPVPTGRIRRLWER